MTVYKQRFHRWNFFHMYRLADDLGYLFFAWRLGRHELITKLFVVAEVYDTVLYIMRPFLWPMTLISDPRLGFAMIGTVMGIYGVGTVVFNAMHLRRMVAWSVLPAYFGMKLAMLFIDTASVYYSLVAYAKFFAKRHPRVTQDHKALEAAATAAAAAVEGGLDPATAVVSQLLVRSMSALSAMSASSAGSTTALLQPPASATAAPTVFEWNGDSTPFRKRGEEVVVETAELQGPYGNPCLGIINESQETLVVEERAAEVVRASGLEMDPDAVVAAPFVLEKGGGDVDDWGGEQVSGFVFLR